MRVYYGQKSGTITSVVGAKKKFVIWGDWLDVEEETPASDFYKVNWKVWDPTTQAIGSEAYRVKKDHTRKTALLEMIFVDVGQGDGCIVSVPDGNEQKVLIVDAGQFSNMHNFLKWRFRYIDANAHFHAAVITHPDQDHYKGFVPLINDDRIHFEHIYHNGLVERKTTNELDIIGPRANGFCTEVYADRASLHALFSNQANRGNKAYPALMWAALGDPARFPDILMASTEHGEKAGGKTYLPGFAPDGAQPTIEILGPVPDKQADGSLALRVFGDKPGDGKFDVGKTKNGHSVILRLVYGGFSAIFGGDLNRPSEDYLLRHYGKIGPAATLSTAVPEARKRLSADLLKCCHHGSADVTDEFVEAVNPFAFVVSSGDQESHVHPRPEVLGLLGKKGRGGRPLILSTELLRSTPSSLSLDAEEKKAFDKLLDAYDTATTATARGDARQSALAFIDRRTRRLVTQYGAITMRSDGNKVIIAFRKEVTKSNQSPWQLFEYNLEPTGWEPADDGGH